MIAFYYGITGYACVVYYRRELLKSAKNFVFIGVLPVVGGVILTYVFIKSCIDLSKPADSDSRGLRARARRRRSSSGSRACSSAWCFMFLWQGRRARDFFRRKPEVADPALLERAHPAATDGGGA